MRRMLVYHREKCTGCRLCEMVCSLRHTGANSRSDSSITIVSNDREFTNGALFCRQCKKPVCHERCQLGAITVDSEAGLVKVNSGKCIGCGLCLDCPLGGMHLDRNTGLAVNCDLCGGSPACMEMCAFGALEFLVPNDVRRVSAATSVAL